MAAGPPQSPAEDSSDPERSPPAMRDVRRSSTHHECYVDCTRTRTSTRRSSTHHKCYVDRACTCYVDRTPRHEDTHGATHARARSTHARTRTLACMHAHSHSYECERAPPLTERVPSNGHVTDCAPATVHERARARRTHARTQGYRDGYLWSPFVHSESGIKSRVVLWSRSGPSARVLVCWAQGLQAHVLNRRLHVRLAHPVP